MGQPPALLKRVQRVAHSCLSDWSLRRVFFLSFFSPSPFFFFTLPLLPPPTTSIISISWWMPPNTDLLVNLHTTQWSVTTLSHYLLCNNKALLLLFSLDICHVFYYKTSTVVLYCTYPCVLALHFLILLCPVKTEILQMNLYFITTMQL